MRCYFLIAGVGHEVDEFVSCAQVNTCQIHGMCIQNFNRALKFKGQTTKETENFSPKIKYDLQQV